MANYRDFCKKLNKNEKDAIDNGKTNKYNIMIHRNVRKLKTMANFRDWMNRVNDEPPRPYTSHFVQNNSHFESINFELSPEEKEAFKKDIENLRKKYEADLAEYNKKEEKPVEIVTEEVKEEVPEVKEEVSEEVVETPKKKKKKGLLG